MKQALLIPIYQPSDKVLPFLKQFKKEDFDLPSLRVAAH